MINYYRHLIKTPIKTGAVGNECAMKQLIFFFSIFGYSTFGVKIKLDTTNGIDSVQILENLFWNNNEDVSHYLDLSEYRLNGTFAFTLPQDEAENVTLLEEEAFSGVVSIPCLYVFYGVPKVTSDSFCSQEQSITMAIPSKSTMCKHQMVTY